MVLEVCAFALTIGFFVFLLMMIIGPPPGYYCKNQSKHEYGPWETIGLGQQRTCSKCGWVQRV
jgi:hypothetical protein